MKSQHHEVKVRPVKVRRDISRQSASPSVDVIQRIRTEVDNNNPRWACTLRLTHTSSIISQEDAHQKERPGYQASKSG